MIPPDRATYRSWNWPSRGPRGRSCVCRVCISRRSTGAADTRTNRTPQERGHRTRRRSRWARAAACDRRRQDFRQAGRQERRVGARQARPGVAVPAAAPEDERFWRSEVALDTRVTANRSCWFAKWSHKGYTEVSELSEPSATPIRPTRAWLKNVGLSRDPRGWRRRSPARSATVTFLRDARLGAVKLWLDTWILM